MYAHKNSTHDTEVIFDLICKCNTLNRSLRDQIEVTFGQHMPNKHTSADAVNDMFYLARKLLNDGLSSPQPKQMLSGLSMYDSRDVLDEGIQCIHEKIEAFNAEHVTQSGTIGNPYGRPDGHDEYGDNVFADITEYVDGVPAALDAHVDTVQVGI